MISRYFRNVIFKNFLKIELNSSELNIVESSLKDKYIRGTIESLVYGLLCIPALLYVDTSILTSVLIPITMVSGTAWFAISLVNIKKKFEDFGSELTVDMYRSFVTALILLSLMTIFSMNTDLFKVIVDLGRNIPYINLISGLLGTAVVLKMIYDIFSGATKYDMNDSMLTGQNEAAEKYFKKSLSLLSSCAERLKQGVQGDVAGYFLGLAFYEIFSYVVLVKGSHEKFTDLIKQAERLKSDPPTTKEKIMEKCVPLVESFLSSVTNTQDTQTAKSYRNIRNELASLKGNKESQNVINIRLATILEEMEDMLAGQGEALFTKRLELEKKFLIKNLPKDLEQYPHEEIIQGYLKSDKSTEERVRKQGSVYTKTIKTNTVEDGRQEIEEYIPEEEFSQLWEKTKGKRVEKIRYMVPYQSLVVELDKFTGENEGLVIAEVEFNSKESYKNFQKPDWFGKEVTTDSRYKNINLAK